MNRKTWITRAIIGLSTLTASSARAQFEPTAHLGITPPMVLDYEILSINDMGHRAGSLQFGTSDTFSAMALAQGDILGAFPIDDIPNDFTFVGGGVSNSGDNLTYPPGTPTSVAMTQSTLPNGHILYQVNTFTDDGSPWVAPAAGVPLGNNFFDSWRFDVGGFSAGTDPLADPSGPYVVVDSGIALFGTAGFMGAFPLAATDFSAGLAGAGVVGLGGMDIAGVDMNEMALFFEVVPEPGTLLILGIGSIALLRHRRP